MSVTLRNSKKNRDRLFSDNGNNTVRFSINGTVYFVGDEIPVGFRLVDFIRDHAKLKGTKYMCREGGCGTCVVTVTSTHPVTKKEITYSVNACLVLVHACNGWAVTTVEGLGSQSAGYHKIQNRLATMNGSQCGYCSPGMVMAMHSFLKGRNNKVTQSEVEGALGGNICRCTGYRPILDTFQSLSNDASDEIKQKCIDIEDLMGNCKIKNKKNDSGNESDGDQNLDACLMELALAPQNVTVGERWYVVNEVREIFQIFDTMSEDQTYMLVGGNTAYGAYRPTQHIDVFIQINNVRELRTISSNGVNVFMGAATTLTDAINFFNNFSKTNANFSYMRVLKDHLEKVAHYAVRNIGSIAGNLMIKHQHRDFASDVFLLLETVGANLVIRNSFGLDEFRTPEEFLYTDMNRKVILNIVFPPLNKDAFYLKTFKIMARAQNTHAIVNAGFLFSFKPNDELKTLISTPRVVFGGISSTFVHATKFENGMIGKQLLNQKDFQLGVSLLSQEINPSSSYSEYVAGGEPPEPKEDPTYRKQLAISLFYKVVLGLSKDKINSKFQSGAGTIHDERPISKGTETYDTKKELWPLTKPMPKVEAFAQCAGEAEYVNDIIKVEEEYFADVLLADRGPATISKIDVTKALAYPGVHKFVTAKDIPGKNLAVSKGYPAFILADEKLFADGEVQFAGQMLGAIIADSQQIAYEAVKLINVVYTNVKSPQLDVKEIVQNKDTSRIQKVYEITPTATKNDVKFKLKGTAQFGSQYQFTMEPQTAFCIPTEDGMDVYSASQWESFVQESVADVLGLSDNKVNVKTRRVGGGFGAKLSRSCYPAAVAAVCTHAIKKPVRVVMSIEAMMGALGGRFPSYVEYEVDVDNNGVIQKLECNFNSNKGITVNETALSYALIALSSNCIYDSSAFHVIINHVITDVPTFTFMRGPGNTEASAFLEHLMDHIATAVKKDPTAVKIANMNKPSGVKLLRQLNDSTDYEKRRNDIIKFNSENRWRKKGICQVATFFDELYLEISYAALSVFRRDASIAITTSGIEIGQGLHTKVAQACAYELGVPVEKISLKPSVTTQFPNSAPTGGSTASDAAAQCILLCCKELKTRLKPILDQSKTWEETITAAFEQGYDLHVIKSVSALVNTDILQNYNIMSASSIEVEVDILTGQHEVLRVDILEEIGQSINPAIDVGQVQGAFVMGLGYWTYENLVRDQKLGTLLSNRTWNYRVPGAEDIPADFRVTLIKGDGEGPTGPYGAKAVGEPPLLGACGVMFAIKQALRSARADAGLGDDYFDMVAPFTTEALFLNSGNNPSKFTLQ